MIDELVDAITGHKLFSFIDAYFNYNQIPMYHLDNEQTSFITHRGLYCYKICHLGWSGFNLNLSLDKDVDSNPKWLHRKSWENKWVNVPKSTVHRYNGLNIKVGSLLKLKLLIDIVWLGHLYVLPFTWHMTS